MLYKLNKWQLPMPGQTETSKWMPESKNSSFRSWPWKQIQQPAMPWIILPPWGVLNSQHDLAHATRHSTYAYGTTAGREHYAWWFSRNRGTFAMHNDPPEYIPGTIQVCYFVWSEHSLSLVCEPKGLSCSRCSRMFSALNWHGKTIISLESFYEWKNPRKKSWGWF